jgi:hypothetical protein
MEWYMMIKKRVKGEEMRRVNILSVLMLVLLVFGCEVGVEGEVEKKEVEVVCRNPRGGIEEYRVDMSGSVYGLTKARSALWDFRGRRVSDGKLVDVVANDCYVEWEVR